MVDVGAKNCLKQDLQDGKIYRMFKGYYCILVILKSFNHSELVEESAPVLNSLMPVCRIITGNKLLQVAKF